MLRHKARSTLRNFSPNKFQILIKIISFELTGFATQRNSFLIEIEGELHQEFTIQRMVNNFPKLAISRICLTVVLAHLNSTILPFSCALS